MASEFFLILINLLLNVTLLQPHVCIHAINSYYFAIRYFVKVPIIYLSKLLSTVAKTSSAGSGDLTLALTIISEKYSFGNIRAYFSKVTLC